MENKSKKEIGKQLGLFLGICLPITWIFMGIGYKAGQGKQPALWAELLITFACFMPAFAAIITSLITKEKLKNLMFMPKFKGNGKVYLMTFEKCKNLKFRKWGEEATFYLRASSVFIT